MFVCVLAAGERARSWHRHEKTEEEIDLEGLAARLFERQRAGRRGAAPNRGDYT